MANLILWALFALVVVINAIFGVVRGLNKSVVRIMLVALAVILTFLIAGPVTTAIANSITVEGQSLGELILSSVNADGSMDMIFNAAPLVRELILVAPAFAISLVVFPVVFGVIKFLTWIAFLFAQKPLRKLIFKENRTKAEYKELPKKMRLISRFSGLGVGVVTGMIIFGMIFTPLFGVFSMLPSANAMNNVVDSMVESDAMTAEDAEMLQEIYGVTDNSLVHFYGFFGTGKAYINSVTRVELDGVKTSLGNELGTLLDMVQLAMQSGLLSGSDDPNAIYALLADPEALNDLMQGMFQSEIMRAAVPDIMAMAMQGIAEGMNMPADKNAVYDNMMQEVAQAVKDAGIDYAALKAYEDATASAFSLRPLAAKAGSDKLMTQAEYEAEVQKLVDLAKTISKVLNNALSGDNVEFTDSVAAHIVTEVKVQAGENGMAIDGFDAAGVQAAISGIDTTEVDSALLAQLTDKEKFETDIATADTLAAAIRESVRAAVADGTKASETASTLASVVSDFAGAVMAATDAEGNFDITKVDFTRIGNAVTKLQNSPLKALGSCVLDMVASADSGGLLGNVMTAVKDGYEKGEDIGGTIGAAGALVSLGSAMGGENNQEAMVNSLTDLIRNLNEFTITLLPTIFSADTVASMGIPAEFADTTYNVIETLLTELMALKGADDYENEVNAIVSLYNLATRGMENFTEDNIADLFGYAAASDAIYNTLVGVSGSNPFGIEIEDAAARNELADSIEEVYASTGKTEKDRSIAKAIAALLGVDKELKLG